MSSCATIAYPRSGRIDRGLPRVPDAPLRGGAGQRLRSAILNLPQVAARLAGGFAIPASADLLEPAIREALDEGGFDELERVRHLPGMTRAVFRTLRKIWAAGFDLSAPGPDGHRRIAEMYQIEARLKARLPPSAMTPRELRDAALKRVRMRLGSSVTYASRDCPLSRRFGDR